MNEPAAFPIPNLSQAYFVAPNATVVGEVVAAEGASIWYGAIVRGDLNPIHIGAFTNLQDGAIVHGDPGAPLVLADYVTVGHGAVLHGLHVGEGSLIGIKAVLLEGTRIGAGSVVGAGAVVTKDVPPGVVVTGIPATVRRELTPTEIAHNREHAQRYAQLALAHRGAIPWLGWENCL
ncbi:MAG: gamma carbonic anhydrase family protein [Oscillatoriales cyanobacterium SM2_1_8]|nr:gamma carbonic anhydrase family protein [Oscillatoriales cyanobacterium SM2_1_8]